MSPYLTHTSDNRERARAKELRERAEREASEREHVEAEEREHGPGYARLLAIVRGYDRNRDGWALGHTPVLRLAEGPVCLVCDANRWGLHAIASGPDWATVLVAVDRLLERAGGES